MIDFLETIDEDENYSSSMSQDERRHRKRLRVTIGELRTSEESGTYWVIDDKVKKLLKRRPSIEDTKLILDPNRRRVREQKAYLHHKKREPEQSEPVG